MTWYAMTWQARACGAAVIACLALYFRRPLGACCARVRRLPETLARLRGRLHEAAELQLLLLPDRYHTIYFCFYKACSWGYKIKLF